MRENKRLCRVADLPTSILASLFAPLMFAGLPNQFPLLTLSRQTVSQELPTCTGNFSVDGQTEVCKSMITSNKVANKKAYMTDLLLGTSY